MSYELISCPLSACFLGMSRAQATAAETLTWSNARGPIDLAHANDGYGALLGPEETGDGLEPTFFQRMFRRTRQSPLSRKGADECAAALLDTLRALRIIDGDVDLTTSTAEDFHGQFDPAALNAVRRALSDPRFSGFGLAARIELFRGRGEPSAQSTEYPNLSLPGLTSVFLPTELSRVVHGVPHDVGSTRGLRREIERALAAFDLNGTAVAQDDPRASLQSSLSVVAAAAAAAEKHRRVLVMSW